MGSADQESKAQQVSEAGDDKDSGVQLATRKENCHRHVQSMMQTLFAGLTESMRQLLKESVRQDSLSALEMVVQCRTQLQLLQAKQTENTGLFSLSRTLCGHNVIFV